MKEYLVLNTKIKEGKKIRYYDRKDASQSLGERDKENKVRDRKHFLRPNVLLREREISKIIFLYIFLLEVQKCLQWESKAIILRHVHCFRCSFCKSMLFVLLEYSKILTVFEVRNNLYSIKIFWVIKIFLKLIQTLCAVWESESNKCIPYSASVHLLTEGEGFLFSWSYNFRSCYFNFSKISQILSKTILDLDVFLFF